MTTTEENNNTVCFSGGADGADILFGELAAKNGHRVVHYGFQGMKSSVAYHILQTEELEQQANGPVMDASKFLGRTPPRKPYVRNLILRNYFQVKDAERIYAITRWNLPKRGAGSKDLQTQEGQLGGGTGWAVAMGIAMKVPEIFLFAIELGQWYQYDYEKLDWKRIGPTSVPRPAGKYAGIGSRYLSVTGEKALHSLYQQGTEKHKTNDGGPDRSCRV